MKTFRILIYVAGIVIASSAGAAEVSHTSYTWFCENEQQAHGRCTSQHSDCGFDCTSLNKVCSVDRKGRLMVEKKGKVRGVGDNGRFTTLIDVALWGTSTVDYCTRNKSKYVNLFGTAFFGQGTSTNCREYSRSASQGGEEH